MKPQNKNYKHTTTTFFGTPFQNVTLHTSEHFIGTISHTDWVNRANVYQNGNRWGVYYNCLCLLEASPKKCQKFLDLCRQTLWEREQKATADKHHREQKGAAQTFCAELARLKNLRGAVRDKKFRSLKTLSDRHGLRKIIPTKVDEFLGLGSQRIVHEMLQENQFLAK